MPQVTLIDFDASMHLVEGKYKFVGSEEISYLSMKWAHPAFASVRADNSEGEHLTFDLNFGI